MPGGSTFEQAKFAARKDHPLTTIVPSVDTTFLYLISNSQDPFVVWKKLANQFEKKMRATRLDLHHKLHLLQLKDRHSVCRHTLKL